jgi:hypothetical protein
VKKIAYSYLLLELLIALALVSLAILPFMSIPSRVMREELFAMQRLELQHVSDNTFALVKERILTREITAVQIAATKEKKALVIDDFVTLPVQELSQQRFARKCYLYSTSKKGANEEEHRLLTVEVFLKILPGKRASFYSMKKKKNLFYKYKLYLSEGAAQDKHNEERQLH